MDHQEEGATDLHSIQEVSFTEEVDHQGQEEVGHRATAAVGPHGTAEGYLPVTRAIQDSRRAEVFHHHHHHPRAQVRHP